MMTSFRAAEDYHRWYYEREIWKSTTWLGVPCHKSVSDLWNYQEIVTELRPSLVVEFGTLNGGSALYFATLRYRVLTVDIDHSRVVPQVRATPNIECLTCSSTNPAVKERVLILRKELPGPFFFILDSDHHEDHVFSELLLLRNCGRFRSSGSILYGGNGCESVRAA